MKARARAEALGKLVKAKILIKYGQANKYINEKIVQEMVQASIRASGGSDELYKRLAEFGVDYGDFRSELEREARQLLVINQVTKNGWDYDPSDKELKVAYQHYRSKLAHGKKWEVESIELDVPTEKKKLNDLSIKVRKIVKQMNAQPKLFKKAQGQIEKTFGTTGRGGYSGWFGKGQLSIGLERAIGGNPRKGQVVGPAYSRGKIFILKVVNVLEANKPTFGSSKKWLKDRMNHDREMRNVSRLIEQLYRDYKVKVFPEKLK